MNVSRDDDYDPATADWSPDDSVPAHWNAPRLKPEDLEFPGEGTPWHYGEKAFWIVVHMNARQPVPDILLDLEATDEQVQVWAEKNALELVRMMAAQLRRQRSRG